MGIMGGRLPNIVKCPSCFKLFKRGAFYNTKSYVVKCVFCGRRFHIWEATLFSRKNEDGKIFYRPVSNKRILARLDMYKENYEALQKEREPEENGYQEQKTEVLESK